MIIFLYGEDTYQSRQKLNSLKDKFTREVDPSRGSLTELLGESIDIGKIGEAVGPGTLLAKKRMIIIEDFFKNKSKTIFNEIIEYLKTKSAEDNIIIFRDSIVKTKKTRVSESPVKIDSAGREKALTGDQLKLFKFLVKQKYTQQFKALSNTEAAAWVKKEVETRGGKINYQAAQMLISLVGNDLWQVTSEIKKLINYKLGLEPKLTEGGKEAEIEVKDVEELVRGSFDENIFALTDAISNKNKALSAKLLEEQIEAGLTDSYLMSMIIRQFRIMLQIRQALDSGLSSRKMITLLKLHPFIIQKGMSQVRQFNLESLKKIFSQLVKIEYGMKTGKADVKTMLDLLIVKI